MGERLVDRLVDSVDLFLFDVKHLSDRRHKEATGAGNRRILENFRAVVDRAGEERVVPRIPVIPGFNSDTESVESTAVFLAEKRWRGPVHLLAHHTWARDKYRMLGRDISRVEARSISAQVRPNRAAISALTRLSSVSKSRSAFRTSGCFPAAMPNTFRRNAAARPREARS